MTELQKAVERVEHAASRAVGPTVVAAEDLRTLLSAIQSKDGVWVPREITMRMRHEAWKADYVFNGAGDEEAAFLAARRETDPEEVEGTQFAYRAMLSAAQGGGDE